MAAPLSKETIMYIIDITKYKEGRNTYSYVIHEHPVEVMTDYDKDDLFSTLAITITSRTGVKLTFNITMYTADMESRMYIDCHYGHKSYSVPGDVLGDHTLELFERVMESIYEQFRYYTTNVQRIVNAVLNELL